MNSSYALSLENVGKRYLVADKANTARYDTVRDALRRGFGRLTSEKKNDASRGEFWALREISLNVAKGDRLAIIGNNGAGKSTLLKILSRITEPTTGHISINGRIASLLEVGTGFHPELTGRENIFLNGSILGMSRQDIRQQFGAIVEFSGVSSFLDLPLKRYSSGMAARLGFAVAAHLQSEILIVDEVLAVGDLAFQKKCLGKMDEVSKQDGKTILFVSHNIAAMKQLCRNALVLNKGRLDYTGNIQSAISHYVASMDQSRTLDVKEQAPGVAILEIKAAGNVKSGDDWDFSVRLRLQESFDDCYFDFGVYNRELPLLTHTLGERKLGSFRAPAGEFTIRFSVKDVHLNAGDYLIGIYLATTGGKVLLNVLDIEAASVTDVPAYTGANALLANPATLTIES